MYSTVDINSEKVKVKESSIRGRDNRCTNISKLHQENQGRNKVTVVNVVSNNINVSRLNRGCSRIEKKGQESESERANAPIKCKDPPRVPTSQRNARRPANGPRDVKGPRK